MHCARLRTRRSRARNTTPFACCAWLFTGTKRMLGRWAASQIAPVGFAGITPWDRFAAASTVSFFCRFTYGLT